MRTTSWTALLVAIAASMPAAAAATNIYPPSAANCLQQIELRTAQLVEAVQNEIRTSIRVNLVAHKSVCSGPFACVGGPKNNIPCPNNAFCGSAGGAPFECQPRYNAGIAVVLKNAKANLRAQIRSACKQADLNLLYGTDGSVRCPDASSPFDATDLANCILRTSVGKIGASHLLGTVGNLLAPGAPDFAVDNPIPTGICNVTLGGLLDVGATSTSSVDVDIVGRVEPLLPDGCTSGNPLCATKGRIEIGNQIRAPQQTFAGIIPICITTTFRDAGNGTTQDGFVNLATGEQQAITHEDLRIQIGVLCPVCAAPKVCSAGAHAGMACSNPGETDIACPPTVIGAPPVIVAALDRSTETHALNVPVSGPGVQNPAQTFCGACDGDTRVGCASDSECTAKGVCTGGAGCCNFGTAQGAFGNSQAKTIAANGTRGPFFAELASTSCIGKTGDALVDGTTGLPGPMRSFLTLLNAYQW